MYVGQEHQTSLLHAALSLCQALGRVTAYGTYLVGVSTIGYCISPSRPNNMIVLYGDWDPAQLTKSVGVVTLF